jgi:ribosome biogenesis protein SSF1/2
MYHVFFPNLSIGLINISKVVLPDRYMGKGNAKAQQSSMKLSELGPRITMELYKVENGLAEGDVLYHKFEKKSTAEATALKAKVSSLPRLNISRLSVLRVLTF